MSENNERKFESPSVPDVGYLAVCGVPYSPIGYRGNLLFFQCDISPEDAQRLLAAPERRIISAYLNVRRTLLRIVDRERQRQEGVR